jgi:predicted naringenin-chalcone synthase
LPLSANINPLFPSFTYCGLLLLCNGLVPDLIEEDFANVVERSLTKEKLNTSDVTHWCIHPGGKRILEAIQKSLSIGKEDLHFSYDVLHEYGNLSSAAILFVLKNMMHQKKQIKKLFGAAFGPGLTVETFTAHN